MTPPDPHPTAPPTGAPAPEPLKAGDGKSKTCRAGSHECFGCACDCHYSIAPAPAPKPCLPECWKDHKPGPFQGFVYHAPTCPNAEAPKVKHDGWSCGCKTKIACEAAEAAESKPEPAPEAKGSEDVEAEITVRVTENGKVQSVAAWERRAVMPVQAQGVRYAQYVPKTAYLALRAELAEKEQKLDFERKHFAEQWKLEEARFLAMLHRAEKAEATVIDLEKAIVDWRLLRRCHAAQAATDCFSRVSAFAAFDRF